MALIKCPECGKEYSDTSNQCPHCGYREHSYSRFELWKMNGGIGKLITFLGVIAVLAIAILLFNGFTEKGRLSDEAKENGKEAVELIEKYINDEMDGGKVQSRLSDCARHIGDAEKPGKDDEALVELIENAAEDMGLFGDGDTKTMEEDMEEIERMLDSKLKKALEQQGE